MQPDPQKAAFLKTTFTGLLHQLSPDTMPVWGKMNLQQMVEHFGDAVRLATGSVRIDFSLPPEQVEKMYNFLMSDKPFRENTPNPILGETPAPVRFGDYTTAVEKLQTAIDRFFDAYDAAPGKTEKNPFFGLLNYEEQLQLLYKHALHHLRQFGVTP